MRAAIKVAALPAAVARLQGKTPITAALDTQGWSEMPLALRERALFSARIEDERFLSEAKSKLLDNLKLQREQVKFGKAFVTRDSFIADLRKVAREQLIGTGRGDLQDVQSARRLGLIFDMNQQSAQGYARFRSDQDPDVLDAFPAQELIRDEQRRIPRNWSARWTAAGGRLIQGRMVALKTDPIWAAISRFGTPWPPFDFGSGMGLRDLSRADTEALGLIARDEKVSPLQQGFNTSLEASIEGLSSGQKDDLKAVFGDQITIRDGRAVWQGAA